MVQYRFCGFFSVEFRIWLKDYENLGDWSKESGRFPSASSGTALLASRSWTSQAAEPSEGIRGLIRRHYHPPHSRCKGTKNNRDFPTFKKLISNLFQMLKSGAASVRTHQSTRFLTSISQILVIFEPDSNLDAENPQKSISYHRTIVPSRKSILHPKIFPIDLYILLYIL